MKVCCTFYHMSVKPGHCIATLEYEHRIGCRYTLIHKFQFVNLGCDYIAHTGHSAVPQVFQYLLAAYAGVILLNIYTVALI